MTDFLVHQQRVLEAHARKSMHVQAQKKFAELLAFHTSEAQSAQAELDALGANMPSEAGVLK